MFLFTVALLSDALSFSPTLAQPSLGSRGKSRGARFCAMSKATDSQIIESWTKSTVLGGCASSEVVFLAGLSECYYPLTSNMGNNVFLS